MNLGMSTALVVDGDESMRNLLVGYLESVGSKRCLPFASGTDAWAQILAEPVDFIVVDWKVRGLSGVTLLNRIRRHPRHATVPLLVISGSLGKEDFRLIQEFPGTYFMTKPFQLSAFEEKLNEITEDQHWIKKNQETIETVFQFCGKDADRALSDALRILKDAPEPGPFAVLFGKRMHSAKFLDQAKTVLKQALQIDPHCVAAMNELARIHKDEGHSDQALEMLMKAHKLAPRNVDRICLLGETEINLSHPDKAMAYFQKALAIDKSDRRAKDGVTVLTNVETYLAQSQEFDTSRNLASLLNNTGIVMVRGGNYKAGLKHYAITLGLLQQKDVQARVCFNLGIGFLRWSKPQEALGWFVHSVTLEPKGGNKSHRYVEMLRKRLKVSGIEATGPRWTKGETRNLDAIDYTDLDKQVVSEKDLQDDLTGAGLEIEEDPFAEESIGPVAKKT